MRKYVIATGAAVALLGGLFTDTLALANEGAVNARRGYFQIVLFNFGPLAGMAKGEIDYDAKTAEHNAEHLAQIAEYPVGEFFLDGTSNEDMAGKTRALSKIWDDQAGFSEAYENFKTATAKLADVAGEGQSELAAAVGEVGKSCGGCHKPYRAKDF